MTAEYILIVSFCTAMRGLPVECVDAYVVRAQDGSPATFEIKDDCKRVALHHRQDHTDALHSLNHRGHISVRANCKWESGNGK